MAMVTVDDARWLADHLRKMVGSRPTVWTGSEITLGQLIALHFISAKAPITMMSLSKALQGSKSRLPTLSSEFMPLVRTH